MTPPLETTITILPQNRPGDLPNLLIERAVFWQRPNFEGRLNRFGQYKREFNIYIPDDFVTSLAELGYPAKTLMPRTEEEEPLNFMKIMVDIKPSKTEPENTALESGSDIWLIQGESKEKLNSKTVPLLDTTRAIERVDAELRAWEWNKEKNPGEYSARLVTLVALMRPNRLTEKYSLLI